MVSLYVGLSAPNTSLAKKEIISAMIRPTEEYFLHRAIYPPPDLSMPHCIAHGK
jgi:hypothetical protein